MKPFLPAVATLLLTALATAITLAVPTADATPMTFRGTLSGANEVPPVASRGMGSATGVLDPTAQTLQMAP
jgi:hypothetical protein